MVKSSEARTAKAQSKIDPTVVASRWTAQAESMKANTATAQQAGYDVATRIRDILNLYSITGNFANTFHALGNELASKARKYSGIAFNAEGALVLNKWVSRCKLGGTVPTVFQDAIKAIADSFNLDRPSFS